MECRHVNVDGTTIKIILGNLVKEKTVCKDTFTNIFSYQVILVFLQDTYVALIHKTDLRASTKREDLWHYQLYYYQYGDNGNN